ncbi:MAG: endonuclease/exonuclease/phosphatase family protein [Sphingomonadaceae bacterium]
MNLSVFKVGTFNLLNLNKPGLAIYSDRDGWTQAEYDLKIAWTARQLRIMNADVFGFQEMWHRDVIVDALAAAGMTADYDLLAPPSADGTRIVCAAIVRKGLLTGTPRWINDFPPEFVLQSSGDDPQTPEISVMIKGFSRPVLHFTVKLRDDEADVNFYVCHFKSKGPTKVFNEPWFKANKPLYTKHASGIGAAVSTVRRTAEAAALRFILSEQMKGNDSPAIVLGDMNDGQHSNTANILTEQPKYLVGDSVGGGDTALYTAQTLQEYRDTRDVYYTHVFQDMRESLDHILVSQEFYDNSKKRLWLFDGLVINNDHLNFDDHKASGTNDHGIIRATFKHRPIRAV